MAIEGCLQATCPEVGVKAKASLIRPATPRQHEASSVAPLAKQLRALEDVRLDSTAPPGVGNWRELLKVTEADDASAIQPEVLDQADQVNWHEGDLVHQQDVTTEAAVQHLVHGEAAGRRRSSFAVAAPGPGVCSAP
jgi:hypothetical protein